MQLVLASGSPRRKQLLQFAQFHFRTDPVKISEIIKENLNPRDLLLDLAWQKAEAYLKQFNSLKSGDILLLTADTMVFLGEKHLGKPQNETEAVEFLNMLSGNTHSVLTGLCLFDTKTQTSVKEVEETKIHFRKLSSDEIREYVATGEPMDKAGAYGIQGLAGSFVEKVEGSWTNVVGLPMELLDKLLTDNGWDISRSMDFTQLKKQFSFSNNS